MTEAGAGAVSSSDAGAETGGVSDGAGMAVMMMMIEEGVDGWC